MAKHFKKIDGAFTMIELMIVVALIAFLYSIAVPQFSMRTGLEAANKVQRLADDVRSAYDLAVLNQKIYRMAFTLSTGEYVLQEYGGNTLPPPDENSQRDPTAEEEKTAMEQYDIRTKDLERLIGEGVKDPNNDGIIEGSNTSPILRHRKDTRSREWAVVDNLEWKPRTLGQYLLITEMQAEHHKGKQLLDDLGPLGRGFIYFFPSGYVERAYIKIAYKKDDMVPDETQEPYTVKINPWVGNAEILSGNVEVNLQDESANVEE
jgi:prepilin-type N-terminal cleavage/methylation domain-containing protein